MFTEDATAYAHWAMTGGWDYNLEGTELTVFGEGAMTNFSSSGAPWSTGVSSATIASGITSLGNYAFRDCENLATVTLPASVTAIGDYAFRNCTSLATVTLPASVTAIGEYAFSDCTSLTDLDLQGRTSITLGSGAFSGVKLSTLKLPQNTFMQSDTFDGCTITDIYYAGTRAQWNDFAAGNIVLGQATVTCTDGTAAVLKITFDANGGGWDGSSVKELETDLSGRLASAPEDPVWSDPAASFFTGWSIDGGQILTEAQLLSYAFTADTTVYAQWQEIYTITLDPNGGAWDDTTTQPKVLYTGLDGRLNPSEIPADPTQNGNAMMWYDPDMALCDPSSAVFEADTTLTAQWKDAYQVILRPNGGTWADDGTSDDREFYTDWFDCVEPPELTREGYLFDHWEDPVGNPDTISGTISGPLDLTAIWRSAS